MRLPCLGRIGLCFLAIGVLAACGSSEPRESSAPAAPTEVDATLCSQRVAVASLSLVETRAGRAAIVRCPDGALAVASLGAPLGLEGARIDAITADTVVASSGAAARWVLKLPGTGESMRISALPPEEAVSGPALARPEVVP